MPGLAYGASMTAVDFTHQTVLITGASSGIGREFARTLAGRGADLVLVARRADRLEALAAELERAHGIRATPIPLDLGRPGAGRALVAATAERGLTITSLINNAGFGTDGPFHEEDPDRIAEEITVDVANVVDIARAFIEPLRQAGDGVLVNVASLTAYAPFANQAVYAACKAFVLSFTEALWAENRTGGLRVLALSPGLTQTEFFEVLGSEAYRGRYQTPSQVVDVAIRALDRGVRRPSVLTSRTNGLAVAAMRLLLTRRATALLTAKISASTSPNSSAATGAL